MTIHRTGGDVDAWCTKCRMLLGHTILAMVGTTIARVRCNTCDGEHAYKAGPPGSVTKKEPSAGRSSPAAPRASRAKAELRTIESLLAGADPAKAKDYSPKGRFSKGDILRHPTFGLGLVSSSTVDKFVVAFPSGEKTLIHGRGEPAPAEPPKG